MRAPGSLRTRIALAAAAALLLVGVVAGVALLEAIERDGRNDLDRELAARAERLMGPPSGPRRGFPGGRRDGGRGGHPPGRGEGLLAGSGTFVQVALGDQVIEREGDVPDDPPAVPAEEGYRTVEIDGQEWRSLTLGPGPAVRRVEILSTLAPVEQRVADTREIVLWLGLAALVATALAAWAFTGFALRPLARLREGASRVSGAEHLTSPLPEDDGPDEVRSLANALNAMLARLRTSMDATRRFAADAGHELRTPLTGMRANLDALDRNPDLPEAERAELLRRTLAEQERIVALLDGLQALARGEAADSLPREDVEFADLVDNAIFAARRRHPDTNYELDDQIGDAQVNGWPGGLRLIVDNLLSNAAVHGGTTVQAALKVQDGAILCSVDDSGPGIPAAERGRVLEPFTRGAGATRTEGTGLGLAIVAQQVALHGGTLELGESPLGGLRATVLLPVAPAA